MKEMSIDQIIADLKSDDIRTRSDALRALKTLGHQATPAFPVLFNLMLSSGPAVRGHCEVVFKELGPAAAPFLLEKTKSPDIASREISISLITDSGVGWHRITVRFATCKLEDRIKELPDWGCDPECIFDMYREALHDESLPVRYEAARALEAFGVDVESTIPVFIEQLEYQKGQNCSPGSMWPALHLGRIGPAASSALPVLYAIKHDPKQKKYDYGYRAARNTIALIEPNPIKRLLAKLYNRWHGT